MTLPEEAGAEATSRELIAGILEQEIEILRRLRPALESRIDRASTLLVVHLANPRARRIRVRIGAGGKPTFLVSSSSQGGVVYSVDPNSWECSCPDHHRRGAACKHAICCFLLAKASHRPKGCSSCHGGVVYVTRKEDGVERREPQPCRRCNGGER